MKQAFEKSSSVREEYDIESLNPRRNPYAEKQRQQGTMHAGTSAYFKEKAGKSAERKKNH